MSSYVIAAPLLDPAAQPIVNDKDTALIPITVSVDEDILASDFESDRKFHSLSISYDNQFPFRFLDSLLSSMGFLQTLNSPLTIFCGILNLFFLLASPSLQIFYSDSGSGLVMKIGTNIMTVFYNLLSLAFWSLSCYWIVHLPLKGRKENERKLSIMFESIYSIYYPIPPLVPICLILFLFSYLFAIIFTDYGDTKLIPTSLSFIVYIADLLGAVNWTTLLLIHLKLCYQIKHDFETWINQINDSTFSITQFFISFEMIQQIISYLGFYLTLLNFGCITFISVYVILFLQASLQKSCATIFICSISEMYFTCYKILFLLAANWAAANVTRSAQSLFKASSRASAGMKKKM